MDFLVPPSTALDLDLAAADFSEEAVEV